MRIAIDIDSTLHHYWDQLRPIARRRFGVELPYEEQVTWGISLLRPEQLRVCIEETHRAENVLAAKPYPGAVATVARWHAAGHFIHITSHRSTGAYEHTARWLEGIGLPFDELYCSYDKISRCTEIGIDVLIDDSPVNLARAHERGIFTATLLHPWNEELCELEDIVSAPTWPELAALLDPVLSRAQRRSA